MLMHVLRQRMLMHHQQQQRCLLPRCLRKA